MQRTARKSRAASADSLFPCSPLPTPGVDQRQFPPRPRCPLAQPRVSREKCMVRSGLGVHFSPVSDAPSSSTAWELLPTRCVTPHRAPQIPQTTRIHPHNSRASEAQSSEPDRCSQPCDTRDASTVRMRAISSSGSRKSFALISITNHPSASSRARRVMSALKFSGSEW